MARHKDFNPERVLDKAVAVFWQQGYAATSVQDLVTCMGIGRGSLYDTFGDKHRLYLAALDRYQAQGDAQLCAWLHQPGPVKPIITAWLHALVAAALDDSTQRGCFMVNAIIECAAHDTAIAARGQAAMQRTEALLTEALVRAQQTGELAAARDPRQIACAIVAVVLGIKVLAKTNPAPDVTQDMVAGVLALLD